MIKGPYSVQARSEFCFAVLGQNPDAGKDCVPYSGDLLTICTTDGRAEADQICRALSAFDPTSNVVSLASRRRKAKPARTDGYAEWADYPVTGKPSSRVGPTCVVRFTDGVVKRMTTAGKDGKPINAGRGVRNCLAAWQSSQLRFSPAFRDAIGNMRWSIMDQSRLDALVERRRNRTPVVESCHFERDGEIVATFDPADCNAMLAGRSAGIVKLAAVA